MKRFIFKSIFFLFLLFISIFVSLYVYYIFNIHNYAQLKINSKTDAVIVLGAAAWGNRPSPVFKERINHAINLYKENKCDYIIFTGGKGFPGEPGESVVARKYAVKMGVSREKILIENFSRNTEQNLYYAKIEAKKLNLSTFTLVSDPYHLKRAAKIAENYGMKVIPSATPTSRYRTTTSKFKFLMKEAYFIMLYDFEILTGANIRKYIY